MVRQVADHTPPTQCVAMRPNEPINEALVSALPSRDSERTGWC